MAANNLDAVYEALVRSSLADIVLSPGAEVYEQRINSYWSGCQRQRPCLILQPRDTPEVAKVVETLAQHQGVKFAVRSGGHTTWQGASNIGPDGITLDLGLLNKTTYDPATKVASIQPGASWTSAYAELDKYGGVVVAGGREGNVGVGGFSLGGGVSWFTPRHGFSCDSIVNFEVVLADGSIVQANAHENSDLYYVLKGGSCNFGIVTRFDYSTFVEPSIWGGIRIIDTAYTAQQIEALTEFTRDLHQNRDNAGFSVWGYRPDMFGPEIIGLQFLVNTKGIEKPQAFQKWLDIPTPVPQMDMTKATTMAALAKECEQTGGYFASWKNLVIKNDPATIQKIVELHEEVVNYFKKKWPSGKTWTMAIVQPLPKFYGEHSQAKGGNVMGVVEGVTEDSILFISGVLVGQEDMFSDAEAQCSQWHRAVETFARDRGTYVDWLYLNYADWDQDPLRKIGAGNMARIRAAALKYDPEGMFQTQCASGFKVSKLL